ncbi:GPALPP motifs-containing protein 1 [Culicoides brevitarsis]|uniref:GPALPP motifs-containing protein 1 n=1 Tax=Culicoides brevitarsis TaxID=469753 RepID=UPI00307C6D00
MASSSTSSSESDVERSRHVTSKHKRKEKSHKKTKKRYKHRSDDDEKGYKKFKRKKEKREKREKRNSSDDEDTKKPQAAGPSVECPPKVDEERNIPNAEVDNSYGPALPPHLMKSQNPSPAEPKVIGPVIPSHLLSAVQASHDEIQVQEPNSEPQNDESPNDDDDDDILDTVGPLPGVINPELEQRALEIKLGHVSSSASGDANKEKSRDEWMLELPEVRGVTDLGLTARQFRTKERPDFSDRSQWTDTPADKERKKHGQPSAREIAKEEERQRERQAILSRDAEQERIAKEHKKKHKRDKSLMDLHEKKLKKAKKEKEKEPEVRRPFDRNIDLAANRFDEAQKKSIIKKAQLLDTRFSSGASKFL